MIKTLLKKQLMEMHRSFFYDYRRNKARTRKGMIIAIAGYVFIMVVVLGGIFGVLSYSLAAPLVGAGLGWLYFLITGGIAIIYGAFGSIFNTFSTLYLAKDNDLLLSMPIPVRSIMISRLLGVYVMGWVYSSVVMIPAVVIYYITAPLGVLNIIGPIVYYIMITLIVLDLSTGLGWVFAKLSTKLKNKSIVKTLMVLIGLGLYYVVYFKAFNAIEIFLAKIQTMVIDLYGPIRPFYLFARAGEGNLSSLLVVSAAVLAITVGVFTLLNKTFIKIVTTKTGTTKIKYKEGKAVVRSAGSALIHRELKRLTSSSTYLLNCSMGTLIMGVAIVALIIKGRDLYPTLESMLGDFWNVIYVMIPVAMSFILSMNDTTAPSISLEGKSIWIVQSLPVKSDKVLQAKKLTQLLLTLPLALLLTLVVDILLKVPFVQILLTLALVTVMEFIFADFGLFLNLLRPNLNWTSEAMVVKQGLSIFIALFSGWVLGALMAVTAIFLGNRMGSILLLSCWLLLLAVLLLLLERWLRKKGAIIFANL